MAATGVPCNVPSTRVPACPVTVETGKFGMSENGTASGESISSASPPRPEPRISATFGSMAPRARTAAAASATRSGVDDTAESARCTIETDISCSGRAQCQARVLALWRVARQLGIDLSGGDTGVAQQLAQLFEVQSLDDVMRGKRVPQHVRRHHRRQAGFAHQALHDQPESL